MRVSRAIVVVEHADVFKKVIDCVDEEKMMKFGEISLVDQLFPLQLG